MSIQPPAIPEKFKKGFASIAETSQDGRNLDVEVDVHEGYELRLAMMIAAFILIYKLKEVVVVKPQLKPDDIKPPTYEVEVKKEEPTAKEVEAEQAKIAKVQFDFNSKGVERLVFDFRRTK